MIQPDDIRRKAELLYPAAIQAWLTGDETFFPHIVRSRKTPDSGDLASAIQAVRRLREGSKESRGFGYKVEWREINSRTFGRNLFPDRILFESREDLLRLIGKQREFESLVAAVARLRAAFPELEEWIRSKTDSLLKVAPDLSGLLLVLNYFRAHPRPDCFARELPLPVDTKFIERHERLLREWLDLVLPPHAIRADEEHFHRRYGLRYAEPLVLLRFLDPSLQQELGFPCQTLALPLHVLGNLPARDVAVFIVENKVNLLTLPPLPRTIGLGALGDGVTLLRYVPWLSQAAISYWGDLDVEGLEILSSLRAIFPQSSSFLMDATALAQWEHLAVKGTARTPSLPPHLMAHESDAFARCAANNLRLEQECIPQAAVLEMLSQR